MKLKLVKLENRNEQQLFDMLDEWYSAGEKIVPNAITTKKVQKLSQILDITF